MQWRRAFSEASTIFQQSHVPQILAGLSNGKHVGSEVPAAYTVEASQCR